MLALFALFLPMSSLFLFPYAGAPHLGKINDVYTCKYYVRQDDVNWVGKEGDLFPPELLQSDETMPESQPDCKTAFERLYEWDGRSLEIFEFGLRGNALIAGLAADMALGGGSGDFTGDISDVFDLFIMGTANADLLEDGKRAFSKEFCSWTETILWLTYTSLFIRLFNIPLQGPKYIPLGLSLCQEVSFMILRGIAWYYFHQPVSVLFLKNIVSIIMEGYEFCTSGSEIEEGNGEDEEDDS